MSNQISDALQWRTYSVRRRDKTLLLSFILDALRERGCSIVHASEPDVAPFFLVFETPDGERHGVLAYAFLANSKLTKNRPVDEHRFQIKYGGDLRGVIDVFVDPHRLLTTIFLGIDLERRIFVAADPLMNTPAPMSRSVEFKADHVERVLDVGWTAWERERHLPKSRNRPTAILEDNIRTEVLIGAKQDRLLDLIVLERLSYGLDPGERHLVAERLGATPASHEDGGASHELLRELDIKAGALFDLIQNANRLKMAVRGWVAENHLVGQLGGIPGVTSCERITAEGQPDVRLTWKGGPPILIECKNTLRTTYKGNIPKIDFQRTRASKADPCSRYYAPSEFQVLAACLHSITENWEFRFARTVDLPRHAHCEGRLSSAIRVAEPEFVDNPASVFDKCSHFV